MKVQQTSSQEVNLRRDATAATEGHSFHGAAVAFHQQSTLAWRVGVLDQEATSPVWVEDCLRTNFFFKKELNTSALLHGLTRRTGLLGLRIASPDEQDYSAEFTSLASRQHIRPYPTCGTSGPCRKSLTRRTGLLGKSRLVTTIASPCNPECAVTDLTGPAWIPGCRTVAIRQ